MTAPAGTLVLARRDISSLMAPADWLAAVEEGFRAAAEGRAHAPAPLHVEADGGGFHGKAASLRLDRLYVALKFNGNFPDNPATRGLPTVQGTVLLCDGEAGSVLAIMDSIEITLRRTAAASALAARYLARPDSSTMLIVGCGDQAPAQLEAMRGVLPLRRLLAFDRDRARAEVFAGGAGIEAEIADDLAAAARESDVIVTATPAREPFLEPDMVRDGTFIAAVGADNPHKCEIAPALMARATVVADVLDQCAVMGDLNHAIAAGAMGRDDVHAELADLVAGARPGRRSDKEITLFDSTGTGLQDVAAAISIYRLALAKGVALRVELGAA